MRAFLDDLEAIDPGLALPWVSTAEFDKVPADLSVDGLVRIFEHSRSKEMGYSDTPGPGYDVDLSPEDGTARRIIARVGGAGNQCPQQCPGVVCRRRRMFPPNCDGCSNRMSGTRS